MIVKKPKRIAWAAMLLAAAYVFAGCTASGVVDTIPQNSPPPQTEAPAKAVNASAETSAPEQAASHHVTDLDGDGLGDEVVVTLVKQEDGEAYASLDIALGSGKTIRQLIPGWWYSNYTLACADLSGNGRDDILLALPTGGSNYGGIEAFVYALEGDGLVEYPSNFIRNADISAEQPTDYNYGAGFQPVDADIIADGGENLLYFVDEIDSRMDVAWGIAAQWAGDGWLVRKAELITLYEREPIELDMDPQMPSNPEQSGYDWDTEIIFLEAKNDGLDPDTSYYDLERGRMTVPLRRIAADALDKLYKITDQRLDKCYVTVIGDHATTHTYYLCFTADERYHFDREKFYRVSVDCCTGAYIDGHILYSEDVPYSPISRKVG